MKTIIRYKWIILVAAVIVLLLALTIVSALFPGRALGSSGILGSAFGPFQTSLDAVSERVNLFWNSGRVIDELRAENARLRQHAASVEEQARLYQVTLEENERLRNFLDFKQRWRHFEGLPATITARDTDNYARTFTISRGERHGVHPNMLVLNEYGQLVGLIAEVGADWAVLRTVVDSEFACGAYVFRPGVDGVCRGRFDIMREGLLTMIGFNPDADIKNGDEVLTSGVGGLFPRDIIIGYVSELEADINGMTVTAIITPAADLTHIDQVFLVTSFESED
jgi:rod shape-determining protein MreC